jgi:hypothetical protein
MIRSWFQLQYQRIMKYTQEIKPQMSRFHYNQIENQVINFKHSK